jgi:putative transposase
MAGKRKHHTAVFQAQVARAAINGERTANELAGQFGAHPTLIHAGKKQLLAGAAAVFASGRTFDTAGAAARQAEPLEQIGRLQMELEWVEKKAAALG